LAGQASIDGVLRLYREDISKCIIDKFKEAEKEDNYKLLNVIKMCW
jgi:hypothetical protein